MESKLPAGEQSNEEIVEELTKDLKESCIKANDIAPEKNDKSSREKKNSDDPWDNIGKDPDDEEQEEDKAVITELPDDFIDEEALKDREVGLTAEEREKLKEEAESLKNEGNNFFKRGEYQRAMSTYTQGIQRCPLSFEKERAILYANRAAAKSKYVIEKETAISDCTKAIELNPNYLKAYLRRAQLYEETDKLDEALEDFKKVLTFDPANNEANYAIRRLPPLINERNEKLKTEMLGKLKDLGNMVLKPFGLSTDNFQLQQDPNSGGYSVKFNQGQQ